MHTSTNIKRLYDALVCQRRNIVDPSIPQKTIDDIMSAAPCGSGFDCGTAIKTFSLKKGNEFITFETHFHHMDENGYYTHWTIHNVKVIPSFSGIEFIVSGKNDNGIKDYIIDIFNDWLMGNNKN